MKKAYPAYFDTYEHMDEIVSFLNGFENLYCVGRNGQHRYNNMDHSMLTAIRAAEAIGKGRGRQTGYLECEHGKKLSRIESVRPECPKAPQGENLRGLLLFAGTAVDERGRCSMLALLGACLSGAERLSGALALRWMAACTRWFKKKKGRGVHHGVLYFVSLSPLTGFLIAQGPVHRF